MIPIWRKSSYSGEHGGDCIEVADNIPGTIPVRDSNDPHGPTLAFSAPAWRAFVDAVKHDRFTGKTRRETR